MHFLAVSLLAILAGTLLLAKFKKEPMGRFFHFISWFFIVVGFILFIGFLTGGIVKMTRHCCGKTECEKEIVIKKFGPGMMMRGDCCPEHMPPGMCRMNKECMHDSAMNCCPKHMGMSDDSTMKCRPRHMMKCCPKHMMKCDSVKVKNLKK